MSINAFAFGSGTLVLTRGSISLLNDECLKGLIAHELGHFSHGDTIAALLTAIGNFPMTFIIEKLYDLKNKCDNKSNGLIMGCFKALYDGIYYLFKGTHFIGGLVLSFISRKQEYTADRFALACGFGKELAEVLIEIYEVSVSKPQSVKEQLNNTHPPITMRIERLENAV